MASSDTIINSAFFDVLATVLRNKTTWIPLYILIGIYLFVRQEKKSP